jgi:hypothetical protein
LTQADCNAVVTKLNQRLRKRLQQPSGMLHLGC